ncbi:MAG: hypothetical protein Q8Q39_04480 [bacterium]|nr:hypothetical protein [bacterium]
MEGLSVNKKVLAALALTMGAVIAVFLFWLSAGQRVVKPFSHTAYVSSLPSPDPEIPLIDVDNDGLTDEEEAALGTNPRNPDTDADGYLDGEEIAQNTDPMEHTSMPEAPSLQSLAYDPSGNFSQTVVGAMLNDIADNDRLFYTETTSTGDVKLHVDYSPEDIATFGEMVASGFLQSPEIEKLRDIPDADLIILPDTSKEAASAYMERLMAIIGDDMVLAELQQFYQELEKTIVSEAEGASPQLIALGQKTITPSLVIVERNLRALPVPEMWKELHKDQIAMIAGHRLAVSYLVTSSGDPMKSLYGLALLQQLQTDADLWRQQAIELLQA